MHQKLDCWSALCRIPGWLNAVACTRLQVSCSAVHCGVLPGGRSTAGQRGSYAVLLLVHICG